MPHAWAEAVAAPLCHSLVLPLPGWEDADATCACKVCSSHVHVYILVNDCAHRRPPSTLLPCNSLA